MAARTTDVPLARDASERFLPWLIAFMVYLATLALVAALVLHKAVESWDSGFAGEITVELPPPVESSESQEDRVDRAVELLRATPGIASAAPLRPEEVRELLEPWLGSGAADENLPLPVLVAVSLDVADPPDLAALGERLAEAVPGAAIDDHRQWLVKVLDLARFVELVAAGVVLLVTAAAALAVVFATRTGLSVHRQAIELLHLIGARDAYIARQFQGHALRLGLRGGVIGTALAAATIVPIGYMARQVDSALLPSISVAPVEWAAFAALPLIAALVVMVTARATVLASLARMP